MTSRKTEPGAKERGTLSVGSCAGGCRVNDILDLLCREYNFEPDSKLHAVCAALSLPDCCAISAACPAVFVFLGAYLDRVGLSAAEISRWSRDFRAHLEGFAPLDSISDVVRLTLEYLGERTETLSRVEEKRSENPAQYYKSIYEDREQMFRHFPYSLEKKLTRAVMNADEAAAMSAFRELNNAGSKATLAEDSVRSAKNSVICSCVLLTRAAIQAGAAPEEAFSLSDAVIKHIEEFRSRWDVLSYEEDVLMLFIALVKRSVYDTVSLTTRRAIRYIDAHLSEKFSLSEVAAHVAVNPNYLSGLFRKEMNMPITEYIAMRKINESLYFLKYSDHSISDIAILYGFSDQSYYTSVFRRIMGVTPAAYRASEQKEQQ